MVGEGAKVLKRRRTGNEAAAEDTWGSGAEEKMSVREEIS